MSDSRLPPETLDYIVDFLHDDEPQELKQCCLVSKSWVLRARKHLFGTVHFNQPSQVDAWKKTFPDPANSPGCYTRSLFFPHVYAITAADAEEGGWLRAFSRVERLEVWDGAQNHHRRYFRSFLPAFESACTEFSSPSSPKIWTLVCSLPILRDLSIGGCIGGRDADDNNSAIFRPSTLPLLTGTLTLRFPGGMEPATRRLLDLQVCGRLRGLELTRWLEEDTQWMSALMEACSDTLEYFGIEDATDGFSDWDTLIDLSKTTKLKEVAFTLGVFTVAWVATMLRTITSENGDLQEVSFQGFALSNLDMMPTDIRTGIEDESYRQWMDLDSVLVQLHQSHAVHVKVVCSPVAVGEELARELIGGFLPETTKRGIVIVKLGDD